MIAIFILDSQVLGVPSLGTRVSAFYWDANAPAPVSFPESRFPVTRSSQLEISFQEQLCVHFHAQAESASRKRLSRGDPKARSRHKLVNKVRQYSLMYEACYCCCFLCT